MDEPTAAAFRDLGNKIDNLPCRKNTADIAALQQRGEDDREYEKKTIQQKSTNLQEKSTKFSGYRVLIGVCAIIITIVEIVSRLKSWI